MWWILESVTAQQREGSLFLCFTRAIVTPLQEDSKHQFIAIFFSPAIYKNQPKNQIETEN